MNRDQRPLGEVCRVVPGFAFKSKDLGDDGIPVIKIGSINEDGTVNVSGSQRLPTNLVSSRHEKFRLRRGDILLAMTGEGKTGRIREDEEALLNQRVCKLEPTKVDPDFLWIAVRNTNYSRIFQQLAQGAAQANISGTQIGSIPVRIPSEREQRQIVEVITAYDDLIENNRRRIQLLEQAARLLYKEWFVHLRFPGHEHTRIIDGAPEGWEKKCILDVWDISYGKNLPTKNISQTGKYPVHGADRIIGYYSQKNVDESLCLITCRGAGSGNVRRTFGPTFVTNNCFVLRPKYLPDNIRFHFTMSEMERLNLQDLRTGAAQPQLTLAGINHLNIVIPVLSILDLYNSIADPLYEQADCLRRQMGLLAKARDLLLPRLMNGELMI